MTSSKVTYQKIPLGGDPGAPVTADQLDRIQQAIVQMASTIPTPASPNVVTVNGNYTVKGTEDVIHVSSQVSPVQITLLNPSSSNRPLTIKQVDVQGGKTQVNPVTIVTPDGSGTIAGKPSIALDNTGTGSVSISADNQQHWPSTSSGGNPPVAPPGSGITYVAGPGIIISGNVISAKASASAVANVGALAPLLSSGGTSPVISLSIDGSLTVNSLQQLSLVPLSGDVDTTSGSNVTVIQPHVVSYGKIQQESAVTLLGNPTGSLANVSEITLGAGLGFSGTTIVNTSPLSSLTPVLPLAFSGGTNLILDYDGTSLVLSGGTVLVRAALTGDVAASAGSNSTTIQPHVVSYAKMQQETASTLLGNPTGTLANVQEITLGTGLAFSGSVLNATGTSISLPASEIGYGTGTGFTGSPNLQYNGFSLGTSSQQEVQIYNSASGASGLVGLRLGTSSGFTHSFAMDMIGVGWSLGGGVAAEDVLFELNAGSSNQFLFSNFTGGPVNIATGGSRVVRLAVTGAGAIQMPTALGAGGIVSAAVTTGQLGLVTIGSGLTFSGGILSATGGGGGITQLTGDVTAGPGSGSVVATLVNIPNGTTAAGDINFTPITAPATPGAGHVLLYVDSGSLNHASKDASGNVNHGIRSNAGTAHQWVSAIADNGTVTLSQPAFSDISGQATLAQLPSIGANTLLGNPTGSTAAPAAIALGSTSGVMQYVNGSPDTIAIYAAASTRIPFGSGTSGQLTDSSALTWNNSTGELFIVPGSATNGLDITGSSTGVVGFHVKNTTNGAGAQVQTVVENSAGSLGYFGISAPSFTGFAPLTGGQAFFGGDAVPVSIFTQTAQPIIFYANTVEVGRWLSGGGLQVANLNAGGMVKATASSGLLAIAVAGTDYQGVITWPTGGDVLVSTGTSSFPTGDPTFSFDTAGHVLLSGNGTGVNIGAINTNVSLATGITGNANRDRVQLNVGGGALGATGTGDNTLVDVIPANTSIRSGVTAGIYATQRLRRLTYTGASSPTITEATTLYIDGAPIVSGASDSGEFALHVAGGIVQLDTQLNLPFLAGSTASAIGVAANGVVQRISQPAAYSQQWSMTTFGVSVPPTISDNKQSVITPANAAGNNWLWTATGGTAIATTLATNASTGAVPVYPVGNAYSTVQLKVILNNINAGGTGSGTWVFEVFSVVGSAWTAGNYTSLGTVSTLFSSSTTFPISLSGTLSAIPSSAGIVLAAYRSDTNGSLTTSSPSFAATLQCQL